MKTLTPDHIIDIGESLLARLTECDLCPHECGVDRTAGVTGECGMTDRLTIASCNIHRGEEPPLSGSRGSGTIFLSGCSLFCLYCQNYPISQQMVGSAMSIERLADTMISLQGRGAHNINFVTPDHFMGHIVKAIGLARKSGLTVPIVCNSSGWQRLETLRAIDGVFDIYLPDMRYSDDEIARNCSRALVYKEINRKAIREMFRQVGLLEVDENGIARRGMIVRHLVLPEGKSGSEEIFDYLAREISPDIHVSVMSQYFPAYRAVDHPELGRRITAEEFDNVVEMFYNAGLKNGYIQDLESIGGA